MRYPLGGIIATVLVAAASHAAEPLHDPAEVNALLAGKTLDGVYLRTGSEYRLQFEADGTLVGAPGAQGRWWVNDQGQYCRKWETGRLAGHEACLDLSREGDKLVIHSGGKRVAEGVLLVE